MRFRSLSFAFVVGLLVSACGGGDSGGEASGGGGHAAAAGAGGGAGDGGSDGGADADGSGGGGQGGQAGQGGSAGWPGPASICFLFNCASDAECADCSFGRTHCDVASQRCVACDPATKTGCAPGETCTQYGTCVAQGVSCPTDSNGTPTVTCAADVDCAACDPQHQACDAATKTCVACSTTNASLCQPNEVCSAGACVAKCPSSCGADADCAQCGTANSTAHACNATTKTCAECSATTPCPNGKVCSAQGKCIDACGEAGKPKGTCSTDADCKGCGADAIACHVPINGGPGKCGYPASGCSDLGNGVVVLPPPFDEVTNACSSDADCSGVGLALDVGKLLRDATGVDAIGDATVQYDMPVCASVTVMSTSCGVCVPCRTDADCAPIAIDPLASQMFGPLGGVASKYLMTQLFGTTDHTLYTYCEPVAGDYGVCAPCADFGHACGVGQNTGSGCTNDWECAWGETCQSGKCAPYQTGCTADADCSGGNVCAWNGQKYCCRAPGSATTSCVSDSDCQSGEVCAWNGQHFYCAAPSCAN